MGNVVNDRPIGVRSLTEDELVPLTVNQLLLGRTAAVEPPQIEVDPEGYVAADQYIKELMTVWWKLWRQRALPHLLPYYKWEQARRHRNLQTGDICMLLYESKVIGNYRLCRVTAAEPSDDGCVRTVTVGYLPRKQLKKTVYRPAPLETKEVAIQRLVLLVPIEEQQLDEQAPATSTNHHLELRLDKQPRAQATTLSRSLPLTRRPAGAGGQCRAGLPHRLASIPTMLCLTLNPFLCTNPEADMIYNEVLPENVVAPLSYSGPLSMPSALPQYEVTPGVLSQKETKYKKVSLNERSYNEVLPENVEVPLSCSGPLSMPSALSQYEATSRVLSLNEPKYKQVSQNETNYKKVSQNESKSKEVSQNEKTYKKVSQNESKFKEVSQNEN